MKSNSCHKASTAACKVCLGQTKQDLEILLSNQTSFGNLTVKPNKFWKFYCQTKQVLEILLSNQTSFGSFTVKPNKFWKSYCHTKQVLEILLSNQTSFGSFTVKPSFGNFTVKPCGAKHVYEIQIQTCFGHPTSTKQVYLQFEKNQSLDQCNRQTKLPLKTILGELSCNCFEDLV